MNIIYMHEKKGDKPPSKPRREGFVFFNACLFFNITIVKGKRSQTPVKRHRSHYKK